MGQRAVEEQRATRRQRAIEKAEGCRKDRVLLRGLRARDGRGT